MDIEAISHVRRLVDPNGTLPVLEIDPTYDVEPGHRHSDYDIFYNNVQVGSLAIRRSMHETDCFSGIQVYNRVAKGLGLAAYVWAIEQSHDQGRGFATDSTVSASALRIWDLLATRGAAAVIEPFKTRINQRGTDYFSGGYYYAAPAPLHT